MDDASHEILRVTLQVRAGSSAVVGCDAREVGFLRVSDGGRVGFGECAPLPGLHAETLDEAIGSLERWLDGETPVESLPPSAAFAASTAVAMLDGFGRAACRPARVAGFVPGGASRTRLHDASLADASSIKLKIGRADEVEERSLLREASETWPHARLRIDGNRRLSRRDCLARLEGLDPARIEYLEEPLVDPSELDRLARESGAPIALDELVADRRPEAAALRDRLSEGGSVVAWVVRMSAIGALEETRSLAARAAEFGIDAVLSTAFESSFSLRVAVHLAASLPNATRPHGIGTAWVLAEDACTPATAVGGELDGAPLPVPFAEAWS